MSSIVDNSEIFNTFKDQFTDDVEQIEPLIFQLVQPELFLESVNSLFRIFHNHKAITSFLGLDELHKCTKKGETILDIIRKEGQINDESQIDWLLMLSDQLNIWLDELNMGHYDLSKANEKIFEQVKVKEPKVPVSETLKKLHLFYINDSLSALKILPTLEKVFEKVTFLPDNSSLEEDIHEHSPDLIILSESFNNAKTHRALHSRGDMIPTVALIEKDSAKTVMKLINNGILYHIVKPMTGKSLKKVLHSIVKSHFSSRKMILSNKKIRTFIDNLEPLGESIQKIQKICDNPATPVSDLIKAVKSDPISTGIILNATKSPIYGLKKINNIDQAVSTFGKRTVKALILGGLSGRFMPSNLSMYGIDEPRFLEIAHLRMKLMTQWYTKVNPKLLNVLSIAALLGNLGQMLIAREISNQGKGEAFLNACQSTSVHEAEYEFLRTSTAAVTSDILYFWKMSPLLIDTISYSDEPFEAVEEIQPLSLACHIVFSLVPLHEATILPVTPEMKLLLLKNDLEVSDLLKAIAETLQHKETK